MNFHYEKKKFKDGFEIVIGCDEAGRGALAGPVVSAAVMVDLRCKIFETRFKDIRDSKLLSARKREELDKIVKANFKYAIGVASEQEVDEINIHKASLLSMKRAIFKLLKIDSSETSKIHIAIDGKFTIPSINISQEAIVDGDNKIFSIAAASIVAKVYRDGLMLKLHEQYPQYGFNKHKGYGTLHHRQMLKKHGLCSIHRKKFVH